MKVLKFLQHMNVLEIFNRNWMMATLVYLQRSSVTSTLAVEIKALKAG